MPTSVTEKNDALRCLALCIRNEREAAGLTQEAVASHAHVSRPLYVGIELGSRPLPIHRAADFGDSVVIGAIRYLLTQLTTTRFELVSSSSERKCVESMATLSELIRKSGEVCSVISAALEDGKVTESELDEMDGPLEQLEECVRQVRRDVAVRKELKRRERMAVPGIANTRTGSGLQAKVAR